MTLVDSLDTTLQLGEPVEYRAVVVAPLFPKHRPRAEYLTLDEAIPLGFRITEVDAAGLVPELVAENPLESNVLLYDSEELLGAKQNRILNVTVLVASIDKTRIPVSCVEQGRWSVRSPFFEPARHTAYPELRRRKAERLCADPLSLGVAQNVVWDAVQEKAARRDVYSMTSAQADIFRESESELARLRKVFPLQAGQCGALFALGSERFCLDYVSRPEAFVQLYPKLLDGYLLDAIEHLDGEPVRQASLEAFMAAIEAAPRRRRPSAGLGDDLRLRGEDVVGSGLEYDGELIQLSAFSSEGRGTTGASIARPSRRQSDE
jgi:hypothetical protein